MIEKYIKLRLLTGNTDFVRTKKNKPKPPHLERHEGDRVLRSLFFGTISGNFSLCAPFQTVESTLNWLLSPRSHLMGWWGGREQEVAQLPHFPRRKPPDVHTREGWPGVTDHKTVWNWLAVPLKPRTEVIWFRLETLGQDACGGRPHPTA